MAQDKTAEVSEAEIAVHWQEEDYIRPPKTFSAQANLKDAAVFDRASTIFRSALRSTRISSTGTRIGMSR